MPDSFEPKKSALLRIREVLENYSDYDHHLTQQEIIEHLEKDYGLSVERKTIGRNIALLKDIGVEVESARDGSYIGDRIFLDAELRMLIDSVLCSRHITIRHSKDLIERLSAMSSKYFRPHVRHVFSVNDWNKTENPSLFYNIGIVDTAIDEGKQVSFDFNRYGIDKKLHKTASHVVSPYQMIIHNQKYYLMGLHEKYQNVSYYRLDHITNMRIEEQKLTPIRSIPGYENGIDYKRLSTALPYLYNDPIERIELLADECVIDEIIEWFGTDITMSKAGEAKVRVIINSSPNAMEHWAMQYSNYVEVVSPATLRERICEIATNAAEKHR